MRVGFGFDVHGFEPGRLLVIGGVTIPWDSGLAGHSDGDVLSHAIADALLGAAGLGDLGDHWPPTDETKGGSSLEFLSFVARRVDGAGLTIGNVDSTIVAQAPRLSPHRAEMIERISEALGVDRRSVSVKSTTTDELGFAGRGEGIAAFAVVALSKVGE